jgi:hypothetical protein
VLIGISITNKCNENACFGEWKFDYEPICFSFTSGRNIRMITEINGSTHPMPNHNQNGRPRLLAKKALVSGTKNNIPKSPARMGMRKNILKFRSKNGLDWKLRND